MLRILLSTVVAISVLFAQPVSSYRSLDTIALDATSGDSVASPASSLSWSHTVTGSNVILFVGVCTGNNSPSVTYNSVAMTQIDTANQSGYYSELFYLVSPTTGSNTVAITLGSGTNVIAGNAASYSGASQTGVPDSSSTAVGDTADLQPATTVVAADSWLVTSACSSANLTASTGATERNKQTESPVVSGIYDSNGTVSTGSQGMTIDTGGFAGSVIASFKPATGGAASFVPGIINAPVRGGGKR